MNDPAPTDLDDQPPASPAEALAIIEREQERTTGDIWPFFVAWGSVWVVIGLAWFGNSFGAWSGTVAGIATVSVIVGTMIFSGVYGARLGRGVQGPSQSFGMMYGWSWTLAMIGTAVLIIGLARLGGPGVDVLAPTLYVFVVGALYAMGGAFWRCRVDFCLGLVLQVVALVAVFTPVPWNSLVMAVCGGGALIAAGFVRRDVR